ncbi:endonuclease/exonuclease/phosphatase family protein [Nocardioides kribbensis]|uniref:endonuclease/exonuclease/phosphatase family protein n=1 Tax=Nocardioides kribbensis TaxID=305517 RepID=UPI0032DA2224
MRWRGAVWWLLLAATLGPALLLTALRSTDPSPGWAVQAVAFTPLALPLYAAALLLLLGRALTRGRSGRRGPAVVAALVVLGLGGLHAWWWSPLVAGTPPDAGDGARVTVMTANLLKGRADGAEVVRAAVDADVDVLVLEEVTDDVLADMERAGLDELLPERIGETGASIDGTMVLSRAPLGEATAVDTFTQTWGVEVDLGDATVRLLAVHPAAPVDPERWHADLDLLRDVARDTDADVVVGDFNATLDHAPMRRLLDDGYADAAAETNAGWQPTWPANGLFPVLGVPLPTSVAIDHVLVGEDVLALDTRTVEIGGTDHLALVADLVVVG